MDEAWSRFGGVCESIQVGTGRMNSILKGAHSSCAFIRFRDRRDYALPTIAQASASLIFGLAFWLIVKANHGGEPPQWLRHHQTFLRVIIRSLSGKYQEVIWRLPAYVAGLVRSIRRICSV